MSQIQTMFKNLSWLVISQIIASVCGFIWTILIARYLGVSDYGILNFAISLTGILAILMDLGISTHIVRHIATNPEIASKYMGNAIILKILLSIATLFLSLGIVLAMGCDMLTITVTLLFTVEYCFMSMLTFLNGAFQSVEKNRYQAIATILLNVCLLIFILITMIGDYGIYGIALSYILANAIGTVYAYVNIRKHVALPEFKIDKEFSKKLIIVSFPFALTAFFYSIYYSIDMVMLGRLVGDYANGIYGASYKLISVLTIFNGVYNAVFFPVMSKFYKNEKGLLKVSFEKSVKYLMLIMIPIAFMTVLYSGNVVGLIFGQDYLPAASVLSILIWTVCLLFVNTACTNLLNASHKEVSVTKTYMTAAGFNILLNLYLIPHFSYNGAAIATVLSDALILAIFIYLIKKVGELPNKKLLFDLAKITAGSLIIYAVLGFFHISMWLAIPIAIVLYLALLLVFRILDDDDKYIIKDVLGRN